MVELAAHMDAHTRFTDIARNGGYGGGGGGGGQECYKCGCVGCIARYCEQQERGYGGGGDGYGRGFPGGFRGRLLGHVPVPSDGCCYPSSLTT